MPTTTARPVAPLPLLKPLTSRQKWLLLLGTVLFERLFWGHRLGFNGLLYMVFVIGAQLALWRRPAERTMPFWVTAGGAVLSGGLMTLYGSTMAALAGWVSVVLMVAFARLPALRSVGYALLTSAANFQKVLPTLARTYWPGGRLTSRSRRSWFYVRLLGVPVALLLVFHMLFVLANPRYAVLSERLLSAIGEWVQGLFEAISVPHLLVWLLAVLVAGAAVLPGVVHRYAAREAQCPELLQRQRRKRREPFRLPDLRKQYVMVLVMLGLLNALLLVVNAIDVNWLWLGQHPATALEMKQFVHEGTYVLIFSILLAMSIVLWAFRGNLNFYVPGLPWLRWGATVWVGQNAVLAVSVGLRNYYYIVGTGLAYKRIGVCAFLVLTLFGLFTIGLKIWQRRTAYSLVRLNGWAAYAVLLLLAAGNWEVWMARYNLQRQRLHVDLSFLLELPGRTLPAVHDRRTVLAAPNCTPVLMRRRWAEYSDVEVAPGFALDRLDARTRAWGADYRAHRSWQSWNYADWQAYRALESIPAQH